MKTFRIWNKQDSINGVDAGHVLDSIKAQEDDEIFLVIDEYDNINQIETVRIIKSVYKLDANLTAEQTAQAYLDIRVQEDEKARQDALLVKTQAEEIAELKTGLASAEYVLMMGGLI